MILLSVSDAAHLTRVPTRTIQRWVCRGWLTDHGDGGAFVVELEQVTELAEARPRGRLRKPPVVA